ncbi:MAG: alpha/beta fold hydrolase [Spirochaetales bacterium]|nr:alpha/beta fold hydrolase [Spirochaetales bacterium]
MPLLDGSTYRPPSWLPDGHAQSIVPALFRRVNGIRFRRERISTPDGDFLDLDWMARPGACNRLAVLCHGLEGSSDGRYIRGMTRALFRAGWDILAWNYRGCGGEPNLQLGFYHSGAIEDLETVLRHSILVRPGAPHALVGFSLGGNLVLRYLGASTGVPTQLRAAVAISAPCDLRACSEALARPENRIYMWRFLRDLRRKVREKDRRFPGALDMNGLKRMRTFREFDDRFTAPLHGFDDAEDYWARASARPVLGSVRVPTYLLNARNDPFLAGGCFPLREAQQNRNLFVETPEHGGHVGFLENRPDRLFYSERRTIHFLEEALAGRLDSFR